MTPALAPSSTPLKFELRYKKVAAKYNRFAAKFGLKEFTRDNDRWATIPSDPAGFKPIVSDFATVSAEADRLNTAQMRSAILDYFFFPEATPADTSRTHCAVCKQLTANDE